MIVDKDCEIGYRRKRIRLTKEPLGGTSRDQNLVPEVGKSHVSNQFHFCRVAEPEIRGENLADRNSELQVEPDNRKEDMAASKVHVEPEDDPD